MPVELVAPQASVQNVGPSAAFQCIIALTADQRVIACATDQGVNTRTTHENAVFIPSRQGIAPLTAYNVLNIGDTGRAGGNASSCRKIDIETCRKFRIVYGI